MILINGDICGSSSADDLAYMEEILRGLLSGVLYHRQKNVWPCFVLHFLLAFLTRCFGLKQTKSRT